MLEHVYLTIKNRILNNYYPPGIRIVEADLTTEFKVSRGTVRVAMHRLIGDKLLEKTPHRGIVVHKVTLEELIEIYTLLSYLESLAAKLIAENGDPKLIEELNYLVKEDAKAVADDDFMLHLKLMDRFHDIIVEESGNQTLVDILKPLSLASRNMRFLMPLKVRMVRSFNTHTKLVEAINARDGDLAEAIMKEHDIEAINIIKNAIQENDKSKIETSINL
ncbi:GntR family transcriptional regulator [Desulfitobacterium sp. THU1]|uniref:GntR family transcriptional regulator n=1 Tax=Desulfitobacterium sp. THU1 TaxID=3138072 RepID=UPI00311D91B7